MDTIVASLLKSGTALWRTLAGKTGAPARAPGGARVLPAYAALDRYLIGASELDPRLRLLVTQLAAERSRCRWCIERGRHLWREARLPIDALRALPRYDTSPLFSNRERAALRFAEAVTRYSDASDAEGMRIEPLEIARRHLSESEIAAVTGAVAAVHFFNPITGELGADAEPCAPWGAPIGSTIRNFWL